ncbi:hypothetical protein RFI_38225 [Reticulomyxa filosa]|uniref:Uncharacterized protein n=1 Tax=Reticulomyxa filosa TaxID=46433 RepID=X6LDQ0_RETFI|nr:hypothetical protein RFI_38225 [Reticulomyxa filosa]|eukprot:ETN99256.1 hypothetical protein RFI_38225 [Reticulomyxa filosa]
MHKQVLHRLNKSQNFQELARVVIFFDFEELKEVCWNKLNIEIEKGQKDENAANFFSVQNKIHTNNPFLYNKKKYTLRFFGRTLNDFEESNNFKKQEQKKISDLTNSQRNYGLNTKQSR